MTFAGQPPTDQRPVPSVRLAALRESGLLDATSESALDRYTALACERLEAPVSLVTLLHGERPLFISARGVPEPWASRRETPIDFSICERVVASGVPLVLGDARTDPRYAGDTAVRELAMAACLGVPLRAIDGLVIGSLCVLDVRTREWSGNDVLLLESLALGVMHDIEPHLAQERAPVLKTPAAQRHDEALAETMIAMSADCIAVLDADGRLLRMNETGLRLLGLENFDDLIGQPWLDLWPDGEKPALREAIAAAGRGEVRRFEAYGPTPGGDEKWWDVMLSPLGSRDPAQAGAARALMIARDVTDNRRRSEALRTSEAHLRRLLDGLFAFVAVTTPDGLVLDVNEAALRVAGLRKESVLGRHFWDTPWFDHDEDVRAGVRESFRRAAEGGLVRYDLPVRTDSGGELWVDYQLAPLRDEDGRITHLVPSGTDLTQRRSFESRLIESERRFRDMADNLPLLVWVHGPNGDQEFVNRTYCRYFGVERTAMREDRWLDLVHPDDVESYGSEFQACVTARRPFHAEVRVRRGDGRWRWIESWAHPRRGPGGEYLGFVGTSADVTVRKEAEAAMREDVRRKDEFVATIAHELRNPLAPLQHVLDILTRADADAINAAELLETMARQTRQIVRLVDDLLDVSRISRGQVELRMENVDVVEVLGRAVEQVRPDAQEAGHALGMSVPQTPPVVRGDADRLAQVFSNLLRNAVKYTPEQGRIDVAVVVQGGEVCITVTDTGVGIPLEMLPRVFDLFTQVESASESARSGLGIGLAVVRSLVEQHHGRVEVHSGGVGMGSTFTVVLPVTDHAGPRVAPRVGEADEDDRTAPVRRVLVVDDNEAARESLTMLLELEGHAVRSADSARTALPLAETFRPDLVLLDLSMAGLDGFETCRAMRALPGGRAMHIVALTGSSRDEDRKAAAQAGFDDFLLKPLDHAALAELARRARPRGER